MAQLVKVYKVTVLDESQQSSRIMDVPGYSHMSAQGTRFLAGQNYPVRDAYFFGRTNRAELQNDVESFLGNAYWSSLNRVELYQAKVIYG